jgi:hypothetical protein
MDIPSIWPNVGAGACRTRGWGYFIAVERSSARKRRRERQGTREQPPWMESGHARRLQHAAFVQRPRFVPQLRASTRINRSRSVPDRSPSHRKHRPIQAGLFEPLKLTASDLPASKCAEWARARRRPDSTAQRCPPSLCEFEFVADAPRPVRGNTGRGPSRIRKSTCVRKWCAARSSQTLYLEKFA